MKAENPLGQSLPLEQVWSLAQQGTLAIVRGVVSEIELAPVRQLVAGHPCERLHSFYDAPGLVRLTEQLSQHFRSLAPTLLPPIVARLGWQHPFYFERQPNVRVHVPYASWVEGRRTFLEHASKVGEGKVSLHAPHRDSDHGCPINAVNLWLALGRVRPGNGLCVYPRAWRGPLDFRDGVSFELEPGDAVVFSGEHLHTSELNCTEESRCVTSFRLTLGRPRYRARSLHDYVCSHPSPTRWLRDRLLRARALLKPRPKHPSLELPAPATLKEGAPVPARPGIWAVSEKLCAVRTESGRCGLMKRHCPHQGTDLAAVGVLQGERVLCPWHNLSLDPLSETPVWNVAEGEC